MYHLFMSNTTLINNNNNTSNKGTSNNAALISNKAIITALLALYSTLAINVSTASAEDFNEFYVTLSGDWGLFMPKPHMYVKYDVKNNPINHITAPMGNVDLGESSEAAQYKIPGISGSLTMYFNEYIAVNAGINIQNKIQSIVPFKGVSNAGAISIKYVDNSKTGTTNNIADGYFLEKNPTDQIYNAINATDDIKLDLQNVSYLIGAHFKLMPDSTFAPFIGINFGLLQRKATLTSTNYTLAFPVQNDAAKVTNNSISLNSAYDFTYGGESGVYIKLSDFGVSLKLSYGIQYDPGFSMKDEDIFAMADDASINAQYQAATGGGDYSGYVVAYNSKTMDKGVPDHNVFRLSGLNDDSSKKIAHKINIGLEIEI
jgi:hypothetical protein